MSIASLKSVGRCSLTNTGQKTGLRRASVSLTSTPPTRRVTAVKAHHIASSQDTSSGTKKAPDSSAEQPQQSNPRASARASEKQAPLSGKASSFSSLNVVNDSIPAVPSSQQQGASLDEIRLRGLSDATTPREPRPNSVASSLGSSPILQVSDCALPGSSAIATHKYTEENAGERALSASKHSIGSTAYDGHCTDVHSSTRSLPSHLSLIPSNQSEQSLSSSEIPLLAPTGIRDATPLCTQTPSFTNQLSDASPPTSNLGVKSQSKSPRSPQNLSAPKYSNSSPQRKTKSPFSGISSKSSSPRLLPTTPFRQSKQPPQPKGGQPSTNPLRVTLNRQVSPVKKKTPIAPQQSAATPLPSWLTAKHSLPHTGVTPSLDANLSNVLAGTPRSNLKNVALGFTPIISPSLRLTSSHVPTATNAIREGIATSTGDIHTPFENGVFRRYIDSPSSETRSMSVSDIPLSSAFKLRAPAALLPRECCVTTPAVAGVVKAALALKGKDPETPVVISPSANVWEKTIIKGQHPVTIGPRTLIHPGVYIDAALGPINIGEDNLIEEYVEIINQTSDPVVIGRANLLESGTQVFGGVHIGNNNVLGARCVVSEKAQIGDDCVIAIGSRVSPHTHLSKVVHYGLPEHYADLSEDTLIAQERKELRTFYGASSA